MIYNIDPISSAQTKSINATTFTETITTETGKYTSYTVFFCLHNLIFLLLDVTNSFQNPISSFIADKMELTVPPNRFKEMTVIGVSIAILLILSIILIITVVVLIWSYKRRLTKRNTDSSYSVLSRGTRQQIQPQSIQQDSAELYDQIHLSPSTGQTEFFPKPQSENINNPPYNSHPTHCHTENSGTSASAASQKNSPQATYAVIDKNKKKMKKHDTKHTADEKKGTHDSPYTQTVLSNSADTEPHAGGKGDPTKRRQKSLDDMYASDHIHQEKVSDELESNPPPSVEELYTAVRKKSKGGVPVNESVSQVAEDLYTTVMKKPKKKSVNDEAVPSILPHTIEELYITVHRKPKGNTMEDEEEAPPIPPHTVEGTI